MSQTLNERVSEAMAVLQDSLRLAAPVYEAAGASLLGIDTVHVPEFLNKAVVVLPRGPSQFQLRYTTVRGYTVWEGQAYVGSHPGSGRNYVAAALALAAHRAETGLWQLVPGVEAPLMAAATVLLANGWAEVRP